MNLDIALLVAAKELVLESEDRAFMVHKIQNYLGTGDTTGFNNLFIHLSDNSEAKKRYTALAGIDQVVLQKALYDLEPAFKKLVESEAQKHV